MLDGGRVPVVGVFDVVDRHFSFDDAWVGAGTSGRKEFVQDFGCGAVAGVSEGVRGKNPGGWLWYAERPGASG